MEYKATYKVSPGLELGRQVNMYPKKFETTKEISADKPADAYKNAMFYGAHLSQKHLLVIANPTNLETQVELLSLESDNEKIIFDAGSSVVVRNSERQYKITDLHGEEIKPEDLSIGYKGTEPRIMIPSVWTMPFNEDD